MIAAFFLDFDAADRGEVGEGRGVGRSRNDAGTPPLLPIMTALALLVRGELAAGIGDRERGLHAGKQRRVVGFVRAAMAEREPAAHSK